MQPIHFLAMLFVVIGYFTYKVFSPYLSPITIATLLALATYKVYKQLIIKLPGKILPAFVATLVLALIFFAPIVYIITNAASIVSHLDWPSINKTFLFVKEWMKNFLIQNDLLNRPLIKEAFQAIDIQNLVNSVVKFATFLGTKSASFLKDILLILIFYFFANLYGKELLLYFQNLIPFSKKESETIFETLAGVMGVVFNSIIATAIFEGFLFGIITFYLGYDGFLFGILYGFASLIPVIGGVLMWLPLSLELYINDRTSDALFLILYSVIVISIIADTFVKPIIIRYIDRFMIENQQIRINELLIFFSIVAGLSSYGFWGMIIGPAVITLLISLFQIYPEVAKKANR